MKSLSSILSLGLLCASLGTAQDRIGPLLLEAQMLGVGMTSPQGKHVYLRLYSNGRVEYEDERMKGSVLAYPVRRAKLTAAEVKALSRHLNGPTVRALAKEYPPIDPPMDHAIDLTVSIARADRPQTITIRNFSPMSPRAKEAYPAGLIELLCKIERLRKGASFGITANANEWCRQ